MSIVDSSALDFTLLAAARNQQSIADVTKRLSSGLRITQPSDGPAEYTVATDLQTRALSYDAASENMQLLGNMVNVASGALSSVTAIIQKMRSLAVAASSNLLSDQDRAGLQAEITELNAEINAIGSETTFNGVNLFADSAYLAAHRPPVHRPQVVQTAAMQNNGTLQLGANVTNGNQLFLFLAEDPSNGPAAPPPGWTSVLQNRSIDTGMSIYTKAAAPSDNTPIPQLSTRYRSGFIAEIAHADTHEPVASNISDFVWQGPTGEVSPSLSVGDDNETALAYFVYKNYFPQSTPGTVTSGSGWNDLGFSIITTPTVLNDVSSLQSNSGVLAGQTLTPSYLFTDDMNQPYGYAATLLIAPVVRRSQTISTASGADAGEAVDTTLPLLSAYLLKTAKIDLTSVATAQSAITLADAALDGVLTAQGTLGVSGIAAESRFNIDQIASVSLTSSMSNIRDANVAKDATELTRTQLLQSFTTSLLVNQQRDNADILQLFR